jgi:hypothetical protein
VTLRFTNVRASGGAPRLTAARPFPHDPASPSTMAVESAENRDRDVADGSYDIAPSGAS